MMLNPATQPEPVCSSARADAPVLLRVEGLRKSFGGQIVLDGIDLELRQGEVVLLRGENGSGKTTLLNILTGNLEPDAGVIHYLADGSPRAYRFPRRWWQELNPFDHFTPEFVAQEGMGRTWQDVRLFGSQPLRDNIALAAPSHPGENPALALFAFGRSNRREAQINREADAMLARLGLAGRESSSADMISLGQSKRVAIARAVAGGAHILFLDEPLAGLDRQGISDVIAFLKSLVHDRNLTLVIIEHVFNQSHLEGLVTTDWLLEKGKLHRNGTASKKQPAATSSRPLTVSNRPAWFDLLAGDGSEVTDEPLPRGAILTRIRRPDRFKVEAKPVLEISDLVVKRGPRVVIGLDDQGNSTGLDLTLYEGEIAILQAPNGWGKSTLFAAISGIVPSNRGMIRIQGDAADNIPTWERVHRGLRVLSSDHNTIPSLRESEVLALAGNGRATLKPVSHQDLCCASLSGGQRQRVALSALLSSLESRSVVLLDEPFAALDETSCVVATHSFLASPFAACLIALPKETNLKKPEYHKLKLNPKIPSHTKDILADLSAKSSAGTYFETLPQNLGGLRLRVESHTCPILPSTKCYFEYLAHISLKGKRVLDLGCGSGSLSLAAAQRAATHVDALDNIPEAIVCTKSNVLDCGFLHIVNVFESDGFSNVSGSYDLILANLPIIEVENDGSRYDFGLLDEGWTLHNHFLANYRKHLMPGGSAIICHAPLQEDWSFEAFESSLATAGAAFQILLEIKQDGMPWRLYSLT